MLGNNHFGNIFAEVITIKTLFASAKPSAIADCQGEFRGLPFTFKELTILEILIQEFFQLYLQLFPDINMKPKAHFLTPYPEMIRRFGQLVKTL